MATYVHGWTRLSYDGWLSDPIHPQAGVKQGDPMSPALFKQAIDRLLEKLPEYIGAQIGDFKINATAFADFLVLAAATKMGLQRLIDISTETLGTLGLFLNPSKSHTIAIKNVPGEKKCVADLQVRNPHTPGSQQGRLGNSLHTRRKKLGTHTNSPYRTAGQTYQSSSDTATTPLRSTNLRGSKHVPQTNARHNYHRTSKKARHHHPEDCQKVS